jgi:hypothetical protein
MSFILGPEYLGVRLNVMLQPLIEELKILWEGVEAYDCFKKQKYMHNIDVMHQESNFCQGLINTCMNFLDKTKYNDKACMDLAVICDRPT